MAYSHGRKWDDQLIETEIKKVMKWHGIDRMPSASEIEKYSGNGSLNSAISKHGGFRYWARKLNLEIKESETKLGQKYEEIAEKMLVEKGFKSERMTTRHPYDILIDDCVKADIKVSRLFKSQHGNFYSCNIEKKMPTCDLYIVFCVKEELEKVLIIPALVMKGKKQIGLGEEHSIYDKYVDNWQLITKLSRAFRTICG